jgi:hypothetical protein
VADGSSSSSGREPARRRARWWSGGRAPGSRLPWNHRESSHRVAIIGRDAALHAPRGPCRMRLPRRDNVRDRVPDCEGRKRPALCPEGPRVAGGSSLTRRCDGGRGRLPPTRLSSAPTARVEAAVLRSSRQRRRPPADRAPVWLRGESELTGGLSAVRPGSLRRGPRPSGSRAPGADRGDRPR